MFVFFFLSSTISQGQMRECVSVDWLLWGLLLCGHWTSWTGWFSSSCCSSPSSPKEGDMHIHVVGKNVPVNMQKLIGWILYMNFLLKPKRSKLLTSIMAVLKRNYNHGLICYINRSPIIRLINTVKLNDIAITVINVNQSESLKL